MRRGVRVSWCRPFWRRHAFGRWFLAGRFRGGFTLIVSGDWRASTEPGPWVHLYQRECSRCLTRENKRERAEQEAS
jgi:hypothetical protein